MLIRSRLYRKHFLTAAVSVLGFVFAGAMGATFVIQSIVRNSSAPMFFVYAIEKMGDGDVVKGAQIASAFPPADISFNFSVLDEKGNTLFGRGHDFSESVASFPQAMHEVKAFGQRIGGKDDRPNEYLIRVQGEPARYLVMHYRGRQGEHANIIFPASFTVFVLMILVGIAVAFYFIFRSVGEHVKNADRVISELQSGNLKARFEIHKKDEIGTAKLRFNQMADEIEKLVERVRTAEQSRSFLLQELAHDLRTPVASLGSLLETIFSRVKMEKPLSELSELSLKEIEYISRLVEDLLLLAKMNEPRYRPLQEPLDLISLIEEEGKSLELRHEGPIKFLLHSKLPEKLVYGDERLMQRLVRNAFENAFRYARSSVEAWVEAGSDGELRIRVLDDGPGFESDALLLFGERRTQRTMEKVRGGRLSLGLGSVIMKEVAQLHRGTVKAANRSEGGAEIEITLPLRTAEPLTAHPQ